MKTFLRFNKISKKGIFLNNNYKSFIKFSFNSNKNFNFYNELKGYKWYFNRLKKKKLIKQIPKIEKKNNNLEIQIIKGEQFDYRKSLKFYKNKVNYVIDHYKKIWPCSKLVPYHGDLTIENIVFKKKNLPIFIDWENYKQRELWGLDICYFLISIIVLPALSKKKSIDLNEIQLIKKVWDNIFKKKNYSYLQDPISYIKKINFKKNNFFKKITPKMKKQIYDYIL